MSARGPGKPAGKKWEGLRNALQHEWDRQNAAGFYGAMLPGDTWICECCGEEQTTQYCGEAETPLSDTPENRRIIRAARAAASGLFVRKEKAPTKKAHDRLIALLREESDARLRRLREIVMVEWEGGFRNMATMTLDELAPGREGGSEWLMESNTHAGATGTGAIIATASRIVNDAAAWVLHNDRGIGEHPKMIVQSFRFER